MSAAIDRPRPNRGTPLFRPALAACVGIAIFVALLSVFASADEREESAMNPTNFQQMFEISRSEKKGLVLFVQGQTIPGLVTAYSDELVELRSQQYDRIVVRIERIDAMAHQ